MILIRFQKGDSSMKSNNGFSRTDILSFSGNKAGSKNQSGLKSKNRRRTGASLMIETP
jgi:hypothetical protein